MGALRPGPGHHARDARGPRTRPVPPLQGGPAAYYAVLAAKGFLDVPTLRGWTAFDSRLGHHPDRVLAPGVENSSGSLGHGLPLALGSALGLRAQAAHRADGTEPRVVVLVGDGELDEGSNHEAIAVAGRLGVDPLTTVVVEDGSGHQGWFGGARPRAGRSAQWTAVTTTPSTPPSPSPTPDGPSPSSPESVP